MSEERPFRFRLERILRLRRNQLRSTETTLRESERRAADLESVANAAHGDASQMRARIAEALRVGESAAAHASRVAQHETLIAHREGSAKTAHGARERALSDRAAWIAAQRGVKALERLRERVRERFAREEEQSGQRALDEIATRRRGIPRLGLAALLLATLALATLPDSARAQQAGDAAVSGALSADRLLLEIRDRQAVFERRERELEAREATVQELETRVASRIEELKALRAELEAGLSSLDEESELRVRQLAKMYASMPPDRAAPLLEAIDRDLATEVLRRMKHKKSAAVMALLSRPAALSLSRRVALPLVRGGEGL